MRSAEADLERAESVRAAGMSTDVDVLSIRVHWRRSGAAHPPRRRTSTWHAPL